ncbi:BrxE family protein [Myxococcota bacterium]|nr:BrxE family protein [Myxococcota bacterium]
MHAIDFDRLFRLRLVVARLGEMDRLGWWNTRGVLGPLGRTLYERSFPRTAPFAQARVALAVARARTRELWNPPACATLFSLPPEVEEVFEDHLQDWMDQPDRWAPFFAALTGLQGDVLHGLRSLEVLGEAELARARHLKRSVDGRAVPLPGVCALDDETLGLLAAGFFRGEREAPAIPYARLEG